METKKTKTLVITGITVVGLLLATIIYFATRKKKLSNTDTQKDTSNKTNDGGISNNVGQGVLDLFNTILQIKDSINKLNTTPGTAPSGTKYKIIEFEEKTSDETDLVITLALPRPAIGEISSGDSVNLSGFGKFDGTYKVFKKSGQPNAGIWVDASGNIGAIYLKTGKATKNFTYKGDLYPNAIVNKL